MKNSNAAIMGYGVIDGRGGDKLLVNGAATSSSWWDIAGQAQNSGGAQNNFILVSASAANMMLYKITFRNSPMFHVKWAGNTTNKTGIYGLGGEGDYTLHGAEYGWDRSFGIKYFSAEFFDL